MKYYLPLLKAGIKQLTSGGNRGLTGTRQSLLIKIIVSDMELWFKTF